MKHIKEYKGFVNEAAIDGDRQMITRAIENMASSRLKVKDIAREIGRAIDQANIGSTMKEFLKYAMQIKKESIDEKANPGVLLYKYKDQIRKMEAGIINTLDKLDVDKEDEDEVMKILINQMSKAIPSIKCK